MSSLRIDIRCTGVCNYHRIQSIDDVSQVRGTIMILRRNNYLAYPPSQTWVSQLSYLEIRDKFNNYSHLCDMTFEQRKEWLTNNQISNHDLYLSAIPDLYVKFETIGFFRSKGKKNDPFLSDEIMNHLLTNNPDDSEGFWPMKYVFDLFPVKAGSRGKVLVFRPSNWKLCDKPTVSVYNGTVVHATTGQVYSNNINNNIVYPFVGIGVTIDQVGNEVDMLPIAQSIINGNYQVIIDRLSRYSPSFLKSLMQKIIRSRPSLVDNVDSRVYLLATFITLYRSAGALVPSLGRSVSGRESAVKRLAVIIVEDGVCNDVNVLLSMLAVSLLFREGIRYYPTYDMIRWWMNTAVESLISPNYFSYQTQVMKDNQPILAQLLTNIGSFKSDIMMMSSIESIISGIDQPLDCISISHAVDQHCFPEIAWYIDSDLEYPELFRLIWENSSKLNPRKGLNYDNVWYNKIDYAQKLYIHSKESTRINRDIIPGSYQFNTILDDSYIAALVGIFVVGDKCSVITPNDIYQFNATKLPKRGVSDGHMLSSDQFDNMVGNLKHALYDGISVKDQFITNVYFRENMYWVMDHSGVVHNWDQFKSMSFSFPLHSPITPDLYNAITYSGSGVEDGAQIISPNYVIRRLLLYVNQPVIKPYKIGMKGMGVEYTVSKTDTKVFQLLAQIAVKYPAALEFGFVVKHRPLFDHVLNMLKEQSKNQYQLGNYPRPLPESRQLYEHQLTALSRLKGRDIIWMAPGMGKTAIIVSYICNLISDNRMPMWCFYTAPASAIENVFKEFNHRGVPISTNILPNQVTFIEHDKLKVVKDMISDYMDSCLFIIDELHKTLNPTLRTSSALELATRANMFIGMTGTLYKDDNIDQLIVWLQLITDFQVTPKNYCVAISGLISIRCDTQVKTLRLIDEWKLTGDQLLEYQSVVTPDLGGKSLVLDFKRACQISYDAIHIGVLNYTLNWLSRGEGVFVVARNIADADQLYQEISSYKYRVTIINSKNPLSLTPYTTNCPHVVITTPNHCEGYDMTKYRVMVSGVYFSNQATREQLEKRVNRLNQIHDVTINLIHSGIITYVHEKYEGVRNIAAALKGFAKEAGIEI